MEIGVLLLSKDILWKLIQKHPSSQDLFLNGPLENTYHVKCQTIDKEMIRKVYWSCWNSYNRGFSVLSLHTKDKSPGLPTVGVGEVLRRIAGKVTVSFLKEDIKCTGTLQVCAGQERGTEAAIHSMNMMYEDEDTDVILLVNTSNAFNSLNRQSFLHNV